MVSTVPIRLMAWFTGASLGPTLTPFGPVTIRIGQDTNADADENHARTRRARSSAAVATPTLSVVVEAEWRGPRPQLEVRLPGFAPQVRAAASGCEAFNLSDSP